MLHRSPGRQPAAAAFWHVRRKQVQGGEKVGMVFRDLVYRLYERKLEASLSGHSIPRHVGVILDGNRRWARSAGLADVSSGHQKGADHIFELLAWCRQAGVEVVTLWLLSTDNLARPAAEVEALLVNVAVGYGGRRETADAVRSLLHDHATKGTSIEELAEILDVEHIADHLYTAGQPDPDLVIRTSGEQRLGGFLLWQSAHSEFYFCDAYWPAFRRVDFLRALRSYAARHRRFGS